MTGQWTIWTLKCPPTQSVLWLYYYIFILEYSTDKACIQDNIQSLLLAKNFKPGRCLKWTKYRLTLLTKYRRSLWNTFFISFSSFNLSPLPGVTNLNAHTTIYFHVLVSPKTLQMTRSSNATIPGYCISLSAVHILMCINLICSFGSLIGHKSYNKMQIIQAPLWSFLLAE